MGVIRDVREVGWVFVFFFFFKQKTAYEMCGRDWSSDVCSSDLPIDIVQYLWFSYILPTM